RCVQPNCSVFYLFFFSSRRRHTRSKRDWSSDVCSSDLTISYIDFLLINLSVNSSCSDRFQVFRLWNFLVFQLFFPISHNSSRQRSEERRVGKECRSWWSQEGAKK